MWITGFLFKWIFYHLYNNICVTFCVANLGFLTLGIVKRNVLWTVCSFTVAESLFRGPTVTEGRYGFFVVFLAAVGKKGMITGIFQLVFHPVCLMIINRIFWNSWRNSLLLLLQHIITVVSWSYIYITCYYKYMYAVCMYKQRYRYMYIIILKIHSCSKMVL